MQALVAPSIKSQQNHFLSAAAFHVSPVASRLLSRSLASTFRSAKRAQCSIAAKLNLEKSTIVEGGPRTPNDGTQRSPPYNFTVHLSKDGASRGLP